MVNTFALPPLTLCGTIASWNLSGDPQFVADKGALIQRYVEVDPSLTIGLPAKGQREFLLRFTEIATVFVDLERKSLVVALGNADPQGRALEHLLNDQVAPRIAAALEPLVVHASAVQIGSSAVLLLAKSGGGKSTLSGSFDRAGFHLLGDDAQIIDFPNGRPAIQSVYRSLRLLPDSLATLFDHGVVAEAVAPYTSKQRLLAPVAPAASRRLPVCAMYALDRGTVSEPIVRRAMAADACMALVESAFTLNPADTSAAAARLRFIADLVRAVPMFHLSYPDGYEHLASVRAAVVENTRQPVSC